MSLTATFYKPPVRRLFLLQNALFTGNNSQRVVALWPASATGSNFCFVQSNALVVLHHTAEK
jgi:hypothetical protein